MSGTTRTDQPRGPAPDVATTRARLASSRGREFWRSLEELAGDPAFQDLLKDEFPAGASEWEDGLDRRRFLQLAAASLAFAGLSACTRQPLESIVPYTKQPEEIVPGRPRFFATAATLGGYAAGLLVETHEGRPTKIEGNPDHPASLGATDLFAQALVLGLYDPDRSQLLLELGEIRPWNAFVQKMQAALRARFRRSPPGAPRRGAHEPAVRRGEHADRDGDSRRPPIAGARGAGARDRPGLRRGAGPGPGRFVPFSSRRLEAFRDGRLRRPEAERRARPRRRRRDGAARGPRAGARPQSPPRQRRRDGPPHRSGRGRAGRSDGVDQQTRRGHAGRPRRPPGDRRRQPGVRRAGRPRVHRRSPQGAAARPPRTGGGRDLGILPLAHPPG